ncbi:hypothetical protein D2E25_1481 [Bifidobacterium goeldii]|uniref:FHA domain-containing protein n=1 Tax=Bifidobacterium goeldii TaxID=2306975 RepID=A0A430FJC8_9BIFI|nr:FHA domain-containing protein [Bifidobacterium goeldii]RSX52910.1 hypothetical protein D2E25_1481 [Bifidobacterium goeldii]
MNGEQRTTQQWTIRINGVDQISVKPGESIEIGRKPLRPLPDDGHQRLEVSDGTRSMSKRHALFTVSGAGSGTLRDLGSTNGSYVVRGNGDLMRLPVQSDFLLPTSPIRMQFGDVPVDFIRVAKPVSETFTVPDLFGYALDTVKQEQQEPDAAEMSVDDILDLRAGEPTAAFSADTVRRRVRDLNNGLHGLNGLAGADDDEDSMPDSMPIHVPGETPKPASPRDLFADALADDADGEPSSAEPTESAEEPAEVPTQAHVEESVATSADTGDANDASAEQASTEPQVESAAPAQGEAAQHDVAGAETVETVETAVEENVTASGNTTAVDEQTVTVDVQAGHSDIANTGDTNTAVESAASTTAQSLIGEQVAGQTAAAERADIPEEHRRFAEPSVQPDETETFKPIFEPGSVFERVSKGEFRRSEQRIEAGGFTSDDAKRTSDFTEQFEIARHPQLLPFLAMNPSLYDDLYAWLAAQGNADIDAALERNAGYRDYRNAVGK